jgi:hypothetical protein
MLEEEKNFRDRLAKLIPAQSYQLDDTDTLLHSFGTIRNLLWYRDDVGHFWIPEVLLGSLPPELWQVLAFWAWSHPSMSDSNLCRKEAVRFALFWHLAVGNSNKAARWAFDYIKKNKDISDFPGTALYELFIGKTGEDRCAHKLFPPEEFAQRLCKDESCNWRTDVERFGDHDDRNEVGYSWWWNGKKMLPWLQKDYIRCSFPDYVPLIDHEDDVPYDVDHMCPSKDWGDHWTSLYNRLDVGEGLKERVRKCRNSIGGGIGNLHLLASSENRARQDDDVSIKMPFIKANDQPPTEEDARAMADSAFASAHREFWRRVSSGVGERRWNEDRMKAFQQAVEMRAAWLYQRFYDDLGYELWTK